ncbi:uncharacterized protein LOC116300910 [Actinia tenebrosa]|uniref:Uncharacterized protein LOC116300910 n=1 Tax=Actinia tenebrosa TaxID=6105 RepID=A0A6P8IG59_ACTTE|nr:uncharacterized protein LOC116300910 [Actinia tenebrosa]
MTSSTLYKSEFNRVSQSGTDCDKCVIKYKVSPNDSTQSNCDGLTHNCPQLTLTRAGSNDSITFDKCKTALFYAVYQLNNENVVRALIDAGADVNITDEGKTALFYAVQQNNNESVVRALIDAGADVNITDNERRTALFYAVQRSNNESVVRALIDAGADVNKTGDFGQTALFFAVKKINNESVVRALIDAGADVNFLDGGKQNALFNAVQQDDAQVVRVLIDAGIKINIIDNDRRTPLFYAAKHGNADVVHALINAGADVTFINKLGRKALFYAFLDEDEEIFYASTQHDKKHVVRALIDAGADINRTDNEGRTALFYAVHERNYGSVVSSLIEAGADVNIADNSGKTALFFVSGNDKGRCVARVIIEQGGALIDVRDHDGRTPLFFAMKSSRYSLSFASYLLEKGANPNLKDNNGTSIVSFFIENCQWLTCFYRFGFGIRPDPPNRMGYELALLTEHGVQRKTVCKALINALFCKTVNILYFPDSSVDDFLSIHDQIRLIFAYCDNDENIRKGAELLLRKFEEMQMYEENEIALQLSGLLALLIEMGAKPNYVDIKGNNAIHYATRLPFVGIPQETVMEIFRHLKAFGVNFDAKNYRNEAPLQCCLSGWGAQLERRFHVESLSRCFTTLVEVWRFCLKQGTSVNGITKSGNSVYHLILKLFSKPYKPVEFESVRLCDPIVLSNIAELIKLSSSKISNHLFLVNHRDENLNTPLHLWASLEQAGNEKLGEGYAAIFKHLLECGARLNERNKNQETPLHLCKTWKAAKLLLDAGAEPNVLDSAGRSPLLVAVSERFRTLHRRFRDIFYPDISEEPKEFYEIAIESNLDLWSVDEKGNSILELFNWFDDAKLLLEVMNDKHLLQSDAVSLSLLSSICNQSLTKVHWRASLVEIILKARKRPIFVKADQDSPLHFCCRRIIQGRRFVDDIESSVQWTIAKLLLSYGYKSIDTPGKSGQTCLDIAEKYPPLRELLLKPIDIKDVPLLVPWTSVSNRYHGTLSKVARRQECQHTESYWYHKDHLTSGSFGLVFAGINENDGREVAIKRIEKLRLRRPEDKREIENLTALADCEQVVRYLSFFEENDFSYIVLELMEGNLDEYLDTVVGCPIQESIKLSKDVLLGLKFLQEVDILHRDLKPANILYKRQPELCLKIADFGLSRRTGSISTTVYGTNVGTRCWIAPEVLKATKDHSKASDVFSCGLVLHYILSKGKHPFSPSFCNGKSELQVHNETEANVMNGNMEGRDNSLCIEATHLLKKILDYDDTRRPSAAEALDHPLFWSKKKKMDLLIAVGNQPEFSCPRAKVASPLTAVENDLEASFGTIVKHVKWNDPGYVHMPVIYNEMMLKRKMPYDPFSMVELVRFIRNAYAHVTALPKPIPDQLLKDFVFLEYFPNLVMEVFKAVTTHGWDQTREEIKYAIGE